jgi:uncharacterized protein (DUF362 family)/ferredoxin
MGQISVSRCESYAAPVVERALDSCLASLGGIERFAKRGETIVLKPNLLAAMAPSRGVTTHPTVIRALALRLKDTGARAIIADCPGGPVGRSMLPVLYRVTGMEDVAAETGATLSYDNAEVSISNPDGKFVKTIPVSRVMSECDGIINAPKLKTHGYMVLTAGIKNLFGVVPGMRKSEFHLRMPQREMFGELLVDIALAMKPRLTVLDAVQSMQGNGPTHGDLIDTGLLVASPDVFWLDLVAAHIAGIRPTAIYALRAAIARGLAPSSIEGVSLIDATTGSIAHRFEKADIYATGTALLRDRISNRMRLPRDVAVFNPFRYFLPKPLADRAAGMARPVPVFDRAVCTGCQTCFKQCPPHAIDMAEGFPQADLDKCISCFCCQELCTRGAVRIKRRAFVREARRS